MTLLRWILVIPVSFACGIISTMLARVISRHLGRLAIAKMVTGFIAGISLHLYRWLDSSQPPEGDDAHFGCYLWFLLDVRSAKGSDGERDCEWPTRRLAFCIVHTGRNSGGVCVTSIIPIARSVNVRRENL